MAKKKVDVQQLFEKAVAARREAWGANCFDDLMDEWEYFPKFDDVMNAADCTKTIPKLEIQEMFEEAVKAEIAARHADADLERGCDRCLGCVIDIVMEAAASDEEKPLWDVWKDKEIKPCEHSAEAVVVN